MCMEVTTYTKTARIACSDLNTVSKTYCQSGRCNTFPQREFRVAHFLNITLASGLHPPLLKTLISGRWARISRCGVYSGWLLIDRKVKSNRSDARCSRRDPGVECPLPKYKGRRPRAHHWRFQSWRSGHRQAVWKLLRRFCVLCPQILPWRSC